MLVSVADPGFLNGGRGVADLTEQCQNNHRQSRPRDTFVHFLNFKFKWPKEGVASHPIHPLGSTPGCPRIFLGDLYSVVVSTYETQKYMKCATIPDYRVCM